MGLICFNRNVFVYDFEDEFAKFTCLSGSEGTTCWNIDYAPNGFNKLKETLNLLGQIDPKFVNKIIASRYYVPIHTNL